MYLALSCDVYKHHILITIKPNSLTCHFYVTAAKQFHNNACWVYNNNYYYSKLKWVVRHNCAIKCESVVSFHSTEVSREKMYSATPL